MKSKGVYELPYWSQWEHREIQWELLPRYELASLASLSLSRYCQRYVWVLLCEASRMGSLDCFCVILHWDFNVKIKWESKNLKIQYFSVFWDWLWLALIWYKPYSFGGFCVANLNMSSIGENNVLDYSDIYHLCPQLKYLVPSKPVILRQAFAKSLWVHIGPALLRLQKAAFVCDLHGRDWRFIWSLCFFGGGQPAVCLIILLFTET